MEKENKYNQQNSKIDTHCHINLLLATMLCTFRMGGGTHALVYNALFIWVQTNSCMDEFCSWTACLHGSVQILLQIAVVFTQIHANFRPVAAFYWLFCVSVVIGYLKCFKPIMLQLIQYTANQTWRKTKTLRGVMKKLICYYM